MHVYINVPYNTNRSHCARTGCYICISTPHGAPIWTTYIGQIVVGCIQYTMPHRSGLESYVNTNKNHFVFHSIQSETWCIQTWFQGGVYFIRNQFCASLSPCLRRIQVTENMQSGSQNSSCFFGRFSLFLTVWLILICLGTSLLLCRNTSSEQMVKNILRFKSFRRKHVLW